MFAKCVGKGVIVRPVGDRIVLSPPLTLGKGEVDMILAAVGEAVAEGASA